MAQIADTPLFSDANFLAYYKLESGALTTDSKGSYTLTDINSVGTDTGKYGGCADFGASNTNKTLQSLTDWGLGSGAMSFSIWVRLNSEVGVGGEYSFISREDTTTDILHQIVYYETSGTRRIAYRRWRQGVATDEITYDVTMGTANWHHFVMTYDATNLRGYHNGSLVAGPTAYSGTGSGVATTQSHLGSYRNTSAYASADIDDVGIFNDALTANEVLTLYQDVDNILNLTSKTW